MPLLKNLQKGMVKSFISLYNKRKRNCNYSDTAESLQSRLTNSRMNEIETLAGIVSQIPFLLFFALKYEGDYRIPCINDYAKLVCRPWGLDFLHFQSKWGVEIKSKQVS